jgi:hypothetical protein
MLRGLGIVAVFTAVALSAEFAASSPVPSASLAPAPTILSDQEILEARVRKSPVDAATVPDLLIVGARLGNELLTSTSLPDPEMPDTLDVYFTHWQASARARLLLDYAHSVQTQATPADYGSLPAATADALKSQEAFDRARIARIVDRGHYRDAWEPFVVAYRSFRAEVLKEIQEGPPNQELDVRIDQMARAYGLQRLVALLRISPRDTAAEMLRLVSESRARHGSNDSPFYTCDSEIHVKAWHPLASPLAQALDTPVAGDSSSTAAAITGTYRRLQDSFTAWLRDHRDATDDEKNAFVRRTADEVGLIRLLTRADTVTLPKIAPSHP